jgi:hypothetical protein
LLKTLFVTLTSFFPNTFFILIFLVLHQLHAPQEWVNIKWWHVLEKSCLKKKFPQTEIQCSNAGEKIAKKWRLIFPKIKEYTTQFNFLYFTFVRNFTQKKGWGGVLCVLVFSITTVVPSVVLVSPSWLLLP